MAIKQEVNAPLILTVGIISAVLLLVVAFGTEAWFIREERDEIQDKWTRDVFCREPDRRFAVDSVRWRGRDRECQVVAEAFNRCSALGGKSQPHTGFGIGFLRDFSSSMTAGFERHDEEDNYGCQDFSHGLNGFNGLKSAQSLAKTLVTCAHSETIA